MPEGKEIGKAYVTVNLDDQTDADYDRLKARLSGKQDITLSTKLEAPSQADYEKAKAETEAKGKANPAKIPAEIDKEKIKSAFKEIADSIDADSKQSQSSVSRMLTGAAAGWTALGALVSGPAVAVALGAVATGFAAIGIAAEKSSPQVQAAFQTMKTTGTDVLQTSFQSLTPVIVCALNQWTVGIRGLGPEFAQASALIGPGLSVISSALVKAAQTDMPAFTTALGQATPMAEALAGGIRDVATGFAQFLGRLNFGEAIAGLSALLRDVGLLLPAVASLVNAVIPFGNALLSSVIPAVASLVTHLANDLAPTLRWIGTTIQALGPVLNFMAGPTAAVLTGVVAFKALQSTTNALLPVFNAASGAVTNYGNKILGMVGGSDSAIGSFTLMTDAGKKQAVQAAASALATAQQTATTTASSLATLESAAAADASSVSQAQLTTARAAATAATAAEAEATAALTEATAASSFAFGPVGIAIGGLAALMTLFSTNTSKASGETDGFAQQLVHLAQAAPTAAQGLISSDPKMADFINKVTGLGVSYRDLTDAINGNAGAQSRIVGAFDQQAKAADGGRISIQQLAQIEASSSSDKDLLDPKVRAIADAYLQYKAAVDQAATGQQAANVVGGQAAQTVELTDQQFRAAASTAALFGLNVSDVVTAFRNLPGAGSTAAGAVGQLTSTVIAGEVAVKNAEQGLTDYFAQLRTNAAQANQQLVNANHSYQQSIESVADAQHSYVQSQRAVQQADDGVAAAQRSLADANNGVATAENNLQRAQYSERQAQVALTQARADAVEQLKSLALQLNDQVASEQRARIDLFKQTQLAAGQGITSENAQGILAQPTTAANVAAQQSALDLVNAENQLADTLNTGIQLRQKVTTANQEGVNGNPAVVSAAQALTAAQDQVAAANQGVLKAQQAVTDAQAGVVRAEQAVRDAVYAEQRARLAVRDAIYSEQQALIAVRDAQANATRANQLNTTSLDLNTQAGRNNFAQLMTLFNAYPSWMDQNAKFRSMIDDTGRAFGISRDRAQEYLTKLGMIPRDFQYSVTAVAGVDTNSYTQMVKLTDGYFKGGFRVGREVGYASGGEIGGWSPHPKADNVPIMATAGEYMQPVDAVDHYGVGFMEAIRTKRYPKGGDGASLSGYATGGQILETATALGLYGANYQENVNALTVMGLPHPQPLPAYVPPAAAQFADVWNLSGVRGTNQQIVQQIFASMFGWGSPAEWAATQYLLMRESGFNNLAQNPTSTAFGMFQFLNSTWAGYGIPKTADPTLQSVAGGRYIQARYGDPLGAAAHERAFNWYDGGGYMLNQPGINTTGKPEMVLPPGLTDTLNAINAAFQSGTAGGGGASINYRAMADAVAHAIGAVFAGGVTAVFDSTSLEKGLITLSRRRATR